MFCTMTRRLGSMLVTTLAGAAFGVTAGAQDSTRTGARALTLWYTSGRNLPLYTRVGLTHERDLHVVGLRRSRQIGEGDNFRVDYTADLLPIVVSTAMPFYDGFPAPCGNTAQPGSSGLVCRRGQLLTLRPVYGIGVVPLGVQFRLAPDRRVSVSTRASVGMVAFTRTIPDPNARRVNFTLDAGATLDARLSSGRHLSVGLRFNHISNAGTARVNPGMNSRMLELGISRASTTPAAPRKATASMQKRATIWSALAVDQPLDTRFGPTRERDLYMLGLRASWPLLSNDQLRFEYTGDLIPLVVSTAMPASASEPGCQRRCTLETRAAAWADTRSVIGAGVIPFGVQLRIAPERRLSLTTRASVGGVFFTERVPDPTERQFHFATDFATTADVRLGKTSTLALGMRWNRLSHPGRKELTPGMSSRMLEIGFSKTRR